jgi:hypothetical protein
VKHMLLVGAVVKVTLEVVMRSPPSCLLRQYYYKPGERANRGDTADRYTDDRCRYGDKTKVRLDFGVGNGDLAVGFDVNVAVGMDVGSLASIKPASNPMIKSTNNAGKGAS